MKELGNEQNGLVTVLRRSLIYHYAALALKAKGAYATLICVAPSGIVEPVDLTEDARAILTEVDKHKMAGGQEDMIVDIALDMVKCG